MINITLLFDRQVTSLSPKGSFKRTVFELKAILINYFVHHSSLGIASGSTGEVEN